MGGMGGGFDLKILQKCACNLNLYWIFINYKRKYFLLFYGDVDEISFFTHIARSQMRAIFIHRIPL